MHTRRNAVVRPPDYAAQMLHAQLLNVNTTCHNIPLSGSGSGSSVTPAVPRPLGSTFPSKKSVQDRFISFHDFGIVNHLRSAN